jgi:hypothetical protein
MSVSDGWEMYPYPFYPVVAATAATAYATGPVPMAGPFVTNRCVRCKNEEATLGNKFCRPCYTEDFEPHAGLFPKPAK